ncbi:MAG: T9SS type A sorting domain-containing protein [Bacteroidota bacterium]
MKKTLLLSALLCLFCLSPARSQMVWDNFDSTGVALYQPDGQLDQNADNPSLVLNTSAKCARYTRTDLTYDQLRITIPGTVLDLTPYGQRMRVLKMNVFSPKAGVTVLLSIENSHLVNTTNWPMGRYMQLRANTTKTNAWEQIVFRNDVAPIPASGTNPSFVDRMTIMFAPSYTGAMSEVRNWYFDDLLFSEYSPVPRTIEPEVMLQNFEDINYLLLNSSDGALEWAIQNPQPDTVNPTPKCTGYTRNATGQIMYDGFMFLPDGVFSRLGVLNLRNGYSKLKMKVFSYEPALSVVVTFINRASIGIWPQGRAIIYRNNSSVSIPVMQWTELVLEPSEVPDGSIADSAIDAITVQFNQGNSRATHVLFDEIRGPGILTPAGIQNLTGPAKGSLSVSPNPVTDKLNIYADADIRINTLQLTDMQGRIVRTQSVEAGLSNYSMNLAEIPAGVYVLRGMGKAGVLQQKISVTH